MWPRASLSGEPGTEEKDIRNFKKKRSARDHERSSAWEAEQESLSNRMGDQASVLRDDHEEFVECDEGASSTCQGCGRRLRGQAELLEFRVAATIEYCIRLVPLDDRLLDAKDCCRRVWRGGGKVRSGVSRDGVTVRLSFCHRFASYMLLKTLYHLHQRDGR